MGSLSFAEIITILLVVLIVFGPNRLPEFARKLGELMAQARRATSQFSKDISSEWGDAVEPILAVKEDFDGVKKDLKDATAAITGLGSAGTPDGKAESSQESPEGAAEGESDKQHSKGGPTDLRPEEDSPHGQGADTELGET